MISLNKASFALKSATTLSQDFICAAKISFGVTTTFTPESLTSFTRSSAYRFVIFQ